MSKRAQRVSTASHGAVALGSLLSVLLLPGQGQAQQTAEDVAMRARIEAELQVLRVQTAEAQVRWSAANARRRASQQPVPVTATDTIHVGPLSVMVREGHGDRARPYFEKAWAHFGPKFEGTAAGSVSERMFGFKDGFGKLPMSSGVTRIEVPVWQRAAETERLVFDVVGRSLLGGLPTAQRRLVGQTIPHNPDLEAAHRELIVGAAPPPIASRSAPRLEFARHALSVSPWLGQCRGGDVSACWIAIGATGTGDPEADIRLWYGDALMRSLDEPGAPCSAERYGVAGCWDGFAENRDKLAPLGLASRESLVAVALDMGGAGSFSRFSQPVTDAADYRGLIAATASADADVVMAEWLRRVQAAKPDRATTDKEARFGAAIWILLFAALATRSTRWRLG